MSASILHLRDSGRTWWVVASPAGIVRGMTSQTMREVVSQFEERFGIPADGYTRYRGYCRPSEAAMTLGAIMRPAAEGGGR